MHLHRRMRTTATHTSLAHGTCWRTRSGLLLTVRRTRLLFFHTRATEARDPPCPRGQPLLTCPSLPLRYSSSRTPAHQAASRGLAPAPSPARGSPAVTGGLGCSLSSDKLSCHLQCFTAQLSKRDLSPATPGTCWQHQLDRGGPHSRPSGSTGHLSWPPGGSHITQDTPNHTQAGYAGPSGALSGTAGGPGRVPPTAGYRRWATNSTVTLK